MVQRSGRKYSFGARSDDVTIVTGDSVAAAQDGEQNQRADDGNNDRAKTAEAVREESEHRLISSGDAPSFALSTGGWRRGRTSAQPAEARVSILLYDALDFSTDRDDGGGQTRESLSRIASPSAAVARLDPARFAHQVRPSRQVLRL
jgi:hypothetical protein